VIEVQSLAGDSVDNVPGVPGIGLKTAALLINEFGDLETLLAQAETIKQKKRRENLIEFADQARVSKQLVTLKQDVPVEIPVADLSVCDIDGPKAVGFLKAMGFSTLTKRVAEVTGAELANVEATDLEVPGWDVPDHKGRIMDRPGGMSAPDTDSSGAGEITAPDGLMVPQTVADERAARIGAIPVDSGAYETVTTLEQLQPWIDAAYEKGYVAFDTETTSLDAMQAELVGISLSSEPGKACYIPLTHKDGEGDLLGGGGLLPGQIPLDDALKALKPMLEDRGVLKIAQNLKYDWLVMTRHGVDVGPYDDTMLLSYTVDAGTGGNGMDELSERWLGHKPIPFKEVCGSGKSMITFDKVPIDKATAYAAEDADVTLRLWRSLKPRSSRITWSTVYETLERPLVPVLARMEKRGIKVTGRCSRGCPAILRRAWRRWKRDPRACRRNLQCRFAQAARRHSLRQDGPARRQEDQDRGLVDAGPFWRILPPKAMSCRRKSFDWRQLSEAEINLYRCLAGRSTRKRAACTRPIRWPRPPPDGCPPLNRTCRTFRCAPRPAARSARPSLPKRAAS
jgi:DNA polymerase-1